MDGTRSTQLWQQENSGSSYRSPIVRSGPFPRFTAHFLFSIESLVREALVLFKGLSADWNSGVVRKPASSRVGRDTGTLSTLPNQAALSPSWKQEINRRIAAHKFRKASPLAAPAEALSEGHHSASSRAAAAAARVAARYANAPSYSELLAGEARAAVRAAEAASRAALEAQAAAESVLAGLEAASAAEPSWELQARQSDPVAGAASQDALTALEAPEGRTAESQTSGRQSFQIRWEPDMPVRQPEPAGARTTYGNDFFEVDMNDLKEKEQPALDSPGGEAIKVVEPAQPIHANLIEFPRELVATRKVRPRRAEGPFAASSVQLSIFEVDPGAISIGPAASDAMEETSAPAWTAPEWSGIELAAQPQREFPDESTLESREEPPRTADALGEVPAMDLAPLNLRLMAAMVNGALIVGAFLAAAMVAAVNLNELPPLREIEVGGAVALLVVGALYQALFAFLAKGTPGARYAYISLCTFDGQSPTRTQRCGRLLALLLSLLPVGLGIVWAIFDEDRLTWHDRLSRTYLRRF